MCGGDGWENGKLPEGCGPGMPRPRRVPAVAFCTKGCDLVLCALHYAFCNLFVTITDFAPKTTGYANFVPQSPFSATIRSEQRQGPKAPPKFKEEKNAKEKK